MLKADVRCSKYRVSHVCYGPLDFFKKLVMKNVVSFCFSLQYLALILDEASQSFFASLLNMVHSFVLRPSEKTYFLLTLMVMQLMPCSLGLLLVYFIFIFEVHEYFRGVFFT